MFEANVELISKTSLVCYNLTQCDSDDNEGGKLRFYTDREMSNNYFQLMLS